MSMNVGSTSSSGEPDLMIDINTTPLIDVMLVLLIMLIITIPIQTHAVKLNMPINAPAQQLAPPEVVTIEVDFDGTILWNGQVMAGKADLEGQMRIAAAKPEQPEVHLRPNKLVKYQYVAMVMAAAQRLGLKKIGVIGNEQFL
ncbi:MAG: biopolymer transporter ExbD [Proteobacteria bacterium]|nr:biopolymer transporter ExbD [Pseudomonadota bacterium]